MERQQKTTKNADKRKKFNQSKSVSKPKLPKGSKAPKFLISNKARVRINYTPTPQIKLDGAKVMQRPVQFASLFPKYIEHLKAILTTDALMYNFVAPILTYINICFEQGFTRVLPINEVAEHIKRLETLKEFPVLINSQHPNFDILSKVVNKALCDFMGILLISFGIFTRFEYEYKKPDKTSRMHVDSMIYLDKNQNAAFKSMEVAGDISKLSPKGGFVNVLGLTTCHFNTDYVSDPLLWYGDDLVSSLTDLVTTVYKYKIRSGFPRFICHKGLWALYKYPDDSLLVARASYEESLSIQLSNGSFVNLKNAHKILALVVDDWQDFNRVYEYTTHALVQAKDNSKNFDLKTKWASKWDAKQGKHLAAFALDQRKLVLLIEHSLTAGASSKRPLGKGMKKFYAMKAEESRKIREKSNAIKTGPRKKGRQNKVNSRTKKNANLSKKGNPFESDSESEEDGDYFYY